MECKRLELAHQHIPLAVNVPIGSLNPPSWAVRQPPSSSIRSFKKHS